MRLPQNDRIADLKRDDLSVFASWRSHSHSIPAQCYLVPKFLNRAASGLIEVCRRLGSVDDATRRIDEDILTSQSSRLSSITALRAYTRYQKRRFGK